MNDVAFTSNNNLIQRPVSPVLSEAVPRRINLADIASTPGITIHGSGFVESATTTCRFITDDAQFFDTVGKLVDGIRLRCFLPQRLTSPTAPGSHVRVSFDGTVFSTSSASFSVVGAAAAAVAASSELVNGSAPLVTFDPPLRLRSIDTSGNELGEFDSIHRQVHLVPVTNTSNLKGPRTFAMKNGEVELRGIFLEYPNVQTIPLRVSVQSSTGWWFINATVRVTAGKLYELRLRSRAVLPGDVVTPNVLLPHAAEIETVDAAGNVVKSASLVSLNVTLLKYAENGTSIEHVLAAVVVRESGIGTMDPVKVPIVFGSWYALRWALETDDSVGVVGTRFTPSCPPGNFFFDNTTDCRQCQAVEATCNGSGVLSLKPGYWRGSSQATSIYKCPVVEACSGNAAFGGCGDGYTGPKCNVCQDGWGKGFSGTCTQCWPLPISVLLFSAMILGFVFLATAFSITVLQNWTVPRSRAAGTIVVVQLSCTFLQTSSLMVYFRYSWATQTDTLFSLIGTVADLRFYGILASDCFFQALGIKPLHLPLVYAGLFVLVFLIQFLVRGIFRLWPDVALSDEAAAKRLKERAAAAEEALGIVAVDRHPKEHGSKATLLVVGQIFIFFVLQSATYYTLAVFRCVTIDTGTGSISVLESDYSESCESSLHSVVSGICVALVLLFAVFVPASLTMLTAFNRFKYFDTYYKLYAAFITAGVRDDCWYWVCAIVLRKVFLVAAVTFPSDPVDMYIFSWILTLFTFATYAVRPYTKEEHTRMEIILNTIILFGVNANMSARVLDTAVAFDLLNWSVVFTNVIACGYVSHNLITVWVIESYRRVKRSRQMFRGQIDPAEPDHADSPAPTDRRALTDPHKPVLQAPVLPVMEELVFDDQLDDTTVPTLADQLAVNAPVAASPEHTQPGMAQWFGTMRHGGPPPTKNNSFAAAVAEARGVAPVAWSDDPDEDLEGAEANPPHTAASEEFAQSAALNADIDEFLASAGVPAFDEDAAVSAVVAPPRPAIVDEYMKFDIAPSPIVHVETVDEPEAPQQLEFMPRQALKRKPASARKPQRRVTPFDMELSEML